MAICVKFLDKLLEFGNFFIEKGNLPPGTEQESCGFTKRGIVEGKSKRE